MKMQVGSGRMKIEEEGEQGEGDDAGRNGQIQWKQKGEEEKEEWDRERIGGREE